MRHPPPTHQYHFVCVFCSVCCRDVVGVVACVTGDSQTICRERETNQPIPLLPLTKQQHNTNQSQIQSDTQNAKYTDNRQLESLIHSWYRVIVCCPSSSIRVQHKFLLAISAFLLLHCTSSRRVEPSNHADSKVSGMNTLE